MPCCCRFANALRGDDAEDADDEEVALLGYEEEEMLDDQQMLDGHEQQQEDHDQLEQHSDGSMGSQDQDHDASEEGGDMMEAVDDYVDMYAAQQQQEQQPGAAAAAGGGEVEQQQQGLLQPAAAGQQAGSSIVDGPLVVSRVASRSPTSTCTAAPQLPVAATEVAAALGWLPTGDHPGMLAVQLQQPRSANLVCALLLDCEDVRPAFNRSRGGCNIDMQLVMLRGFAVGQVPVGLQVGLRGQCC
jgi:hypothetical protein